MGLKEDTPVSMVQIEEEFEWLLDLYVRMKPKMVLEIGVKDGGTLYHWIKNAAPGAYIVAIDTKMNTDLFASWLPSDVCFTPVEADSHDYNTISFVHSLGVFDWVFIDGDHSFEGAAMDWVAYGQKGTRIVAFHDICPNPDDKTCEVPEVWKEIKKTHKTMEYVKDYMQGECGIGVVQMTT